jgi:hypothetical protein
MRSQHTPGPWKAVSAAACAELDVMEIAEVGYMRVTPAFCAWPTAGTPEADAKLIAAAPEMLGLLRVTAGNIRSLGPAGALGHVYPPYTEWLRLVEEVISKADGAA